MTPQDFDHIDPIAIEREARKLQGQALRDVMRGLRKWVGTRAQR